MRKIKFLIISVLILYCSNIYSQIHSVYGVVEDIHNALINKLKKSNLRNSDLIKNFMYHGEISDNITLSSGYGRSNSGGAFEGYLTCIFNKQDEVVQITYKMKCNDFVYSRVEEEIAEAMKIVNYIPVKEQHLIKKNGATVQGYKHSDWKFSAAISTNYYNHIIEVGFDRNPNAEDKKAQQLYEKKYQKEKLQQEEQERTERIKRAKEQEEQERIERIKRAKEQEEQERIEREKKENVKKIFSSVDEVAIKSKVTNYFNNKYIEKIKTYKGKLATLKLGYAGEVNVMIGGDSLGVDVIKIEHENENEKVIKWIQASDFYCILEGIIYYEFQGKIFYLKKLNIKTNSFEYGFGGLKSKGKKFTYYRNVPDLVKKACEQNFKQRGEYFFYYLTIDDDVSIKKLELKQEERDAIRRGKTTGRKF